AGGSAAAGGMLLGVIGGLVLGFAGMAVGYLARDLFSLLARFERERYLRDVVRVHNRVAAARMGADPNTLDPEYFPTNSPQL
ncbi:MAG: hypothetical protein AB2A00_36775, partial [Myxococcota bacterium]